jgi:NAD(P)-dependent dehydrogenase (short-subunit alcohol dehydrogenase family)
MTFDPSGTTAIVTDPSSGFGLELAHRRGELGADLVLVGRLGAPKNRTAKR